MPGGAAMPGAIVNPSGSGIPAGMVAGSFVQLVTAAAAGASVGAASGAGVAAGSISATVTAAAAAVVSVLISGTALTLTGTFTSGGCKMWTLSELFFVFLEDLVAENLNHDPFKNITIARPQIINFIETFSLMESNDDEKS
jgi:hypothetical protein